MKTFLLSSLLFLILVCGCQTPNRGTSHNPITQPILLQTNVIAEVVTHTPQTNIANGVTTVIPGYSTTNFSTNVSGVVNPATQAFIDGAKNLNQFANPTPAAPIVAAFFTLLSTGLGVYARYQGRKATAALNSKNDSELMLSAVTDGIESLSDSKAKEAVRNAAVNLGVQAKLHDFVKRRTE